MIVLASKSESRRAMLAAAGVEVVCDAANIDERRLEADMAGAEPSEIAQALAAAKASEVAARHPGSLILGGDSLVTCDSRRFDKPRSLEDAREHLRFFSGKTIRLDSAAALARDGQIVWVGADFAALKVRELSAPFIEAYLQAEWPAVAATVGVFRIEALGPQLFDEIRGDYFTVLGMPLLQVLGALRAQGAIQT